MTERSELIGLLQAACDKLLGKESPTLTEDLELGTDSIDSLELIEVMIEIEDRLGIRFGEDDFDDVSNVGQLLDILMSRLESVHA
jgi:acyl carrier protein